MRMLFTALVAAFLCLPAYAETYSRAMAGTGFDIDYQGDTIHYGDERGYAAAVAVGTEIAEYKDFSFAVEGEALWMRAPFDTGKGFENMTSMGLMANGIVRLDPGGFARPYVGGGAGIAANTFNGDTYRRGFNWQAIGGVNLKLNRRVSFDVQYRYLGNDDLRFDDSSQRHHVMMAGVTVCISRCWEFW